MRSISVLLLAALLLSGCAVLTKQKLKPVPETLSQGRLVYLADRACRRFERRVDRPRPGKGYEAALANLQDVLMPAYDRLLFELRGLAPPPPDAVAYRRMLATFNDTDLVLHNFFQAVDEVQIKRLETLQARLDRLGRRLNARATKVGLKTCAKG
jgi:hypothetical protein